MTLKKNRANVVMTLFPLLPFAYFGIVGPWALEIHTPALLNLVLLLGFIVFPVMSIAYFLWRFWANGFLNRRTLWFVVPVAAFFGANFALSVLSRCDTSYYARKKIMSELTAKEKDTVKGVPTLSDESTSCPLYFEYMKEGKHMAVSVLEDIIHGPKMYYEELGESRNKKSDDASSSPLPATGSKIGQ